MIRRIEYTVEDSFHGKPVLAFLRANGYSSRMIKELKRNPHGILVKNKKVTVLKQLKAGDKLTVYIKETAGEHIVPAELPLSVVYEDRDVVVCDKSPGMATHPSQDNHDTTLLNALAYHWRQRGEDCAARAVNRLDKNTSGLILVAKNAYASGVLSGDLREKKVKRTYLALVEGCPDETEGVIDAPIARAPGSTIERRVDVENGERAVTHYKVLKRGAFSLLQLWLETGRTHQIRVHLASIGHPVAGDFLYGHEFSGGMRRHALHSCSLEFVHPVTHQTMQFSAALPEDMAALCEQQWGATDETTCI